METFAVGRRIRFSKSVVCLLMSDGEAGIIPAGESLVVKEHGQSYEGFLGDWNGVDVFVFREDVKEAGLASYVVVA